MSHSERVIIIGGGIIGLLTARELRRRGREVLVLDAGSGEGTASSGNAGIIAPGHFPIANPRQRSRALKLLFDPDSPLYIPPRFDLSMLRWLLGFRRACLPRNYRNTVEVLNHLSRISAEGWQELMNVDSPSDLAASLRPEGSLEVFCDESSREEAQHDARLLHEDGFEAELIDGDELRNRDDAFRDEVIGALVHPGHIITEPDRLLTALRTHVIESGVVVRRDTTVQQILADRTACHGVVAGDDEVIEGETVVLSAGIWSDGLARQHRIRVPMQPAKGYHLMVQSDHPPRLACVCRESMVAVNAMKDGVRLAGTLELSGINHRLVRRRLELLVQGAARCIDGLEEAPVLQRWTGMRPCTADGLPVIGPMPGLSGTWVATGHGMMGITLGPVTALLLGQMMHGEPTAMDTVPMSTGRFN